MTTYKEQSTTAQKQYTRKDFNLKTLNTSLNTAVIASDFFLLDQDLTQQIGKLAKNYTVLDPIVLCNELKQFIRLIFFLRKNCTNSFITLYCSDKKKLRILKTFIARNDGKLRMAMRAEKSPRNIYNNTSNPNASIFFNSVSDLLLLRNAEKYRTMLSAVIDYHSSRVSTYAIRNKIDSLKKIVFLMALLESLLTKK
jgi:hypothetical protein